MEPINREPLIMTLGWEEDTIDLTSLQRAHFKFSTVHFSHTHNYFESQNGQPLFQRTKWLAPTCPLFLHCTHNTFSILAVLLVQPLSFVSSYLICISPFVLILIEELSIIIIYWHHNNEYMFLTHCWGTHEWPFLCLLLCFF